MALKISFKAEAQTEKNGEGVTHKLYIYDPVHGGYDIDPESWEFHTSETSAAYFRKALEPLLYQIEQAQHMRGDDPAHPGCPYIKLSLAALSMAQEAGWYGGI